MALPVQSLVETLHDAGFSLSLAPAGGLAVTPASKLTPELRDIIRSGKAQLIDWLTAANDATSQATCHAPEPPDNSLDWKELAAAYHAHHFQCKACQASGRGANYGQRCDTGLALWKRYQVPIVQELPRAAGPI